MPSGDESTPVEGRFAPWCEIPGQTIVSVEHPGIIRNIENALSSLGGDATLGKFLQSRAPARSVGLLLRPEDPFRQPIYSRKTVTANVALRMTVPKRTGRKRKRGSSEPFTDDSHDGQTSSLKDVGNLLRSLADNPDSSRIEAMGVVDESHRFRALPDFQYSTGSSALAQSLKASVLCFDYESLKGFKLDTNTKGIQPYMDMIPPPSLSQTTVPFNYAYHQNPSVKFTLDNTGKQTYVNTSLMPKTATQLVSFDVDIVPNAPLPDLPPENSLDQRWQDLINKLREILNERPIITRRVLNNFMPRDTMYDVKHALQYVSYMFRSGPWRDGAIKFGLDPRTDPKWRVYQTMSFKIVIREGNDVWADSRVKWNRSLRASEVDTKSHLFDGAKVTPDGKIWQVCDITDPLLRRILDGDTLRSECETQQDGWYNNGAWAKTRIIMRDKIGLIMAGSVPHDEDYALTSSIPNMLDDSNNHLAVFTNCTAKEQNLMSQVRQLARSLEISNRRYGQLGVYKRNGGGGEAQDDEEEDDAGADVLVEDATAEDDEANDAM